MVYLRYYGHINTIGSYIWFTCVIWLLYIGSYKMVYLRYYGYYI